MLARPRTQPSQVCFNTPGNPCICSCSMPSSLCSTDKLLCKHTGLLFLQMQAAVEQVHTSGSSVLFTAGPGAARIVGGFQKRPLPRRWAAAGADAACLGAPQPGVGAAAGAHACADRGRTSARTLPAVLPGGASAVPDQASGQRLCTACTSQHLGDGEEGVAI